MQQPVRKLIAPTPFARNGNGNAPRVLTADDLTELALGIRDGTALHLTPRWKKDIADSERDLSAKLGAVVEREVAARLAEGEQRHAEHLEAIRREIAGLKDHHARETSELCETADTRQQADAELAALREEVVELRRLLAQRDTATDEALREVREEASRERTQALYHLQLLVQDLYRNAPAPVVNVEVPPAAPSVVNVPADAIRVTLPPRKVTKSIEYDEYSRPRTIIETEQAAGPTPPTTREDDREDE